jgi:hypothetical protein
MYVATIPNRGSPPAILLRESYREAGKTKNRTLANLSDWPSERIELFRAVLRGDELAPVGSNGFEIRRSLTHGHVPAALTVARRIAVNRHAKGTPYQRPKGTPFITLSMKPLMFLCSAERGRFFAPAYLHRALCSLRSRMAHRLAARSVL